jgi:hypothetical protein
MQSFQSTFTKEATVKVTLKIDENVNKPDSPDSPPVVKAGKSYLNMLGSTCRRILPIGGTMNLSAGVEMFVSASVPGMLPL